MPERCIQRRIFRPIRRRAVGVAGAVFELEDRAVRVQRWEGVHVRVEGVGVVDVEGACVDLVEAEAAVEICQRGDAGADPPWCQCCVKGLDAAVVGVVDHLLVLVRVAEEDVGDDVRGVAVYDLVEEVCWVGEGVCPVPA